MPQTQPARNEEPFFNLTETGDEFETALRSAVQNNARSMSELRDAIRNCMVSLREDGMQCEQALLTMKAFVRDATIRHKRGGSRVLHPSERLMEQVIGWCIAEYYADC
jgi:hypothetical protein